MLRIKEARQEIADRVLKLQNALQALDDLAKVMGEEGHVIDGEFGEVPVEVIAPITGLKVVETTHYIKNSKRVAKRVAAARARARARRAKAKRVYHLPRRYRMARNS